MGGNGDRLILWPSGTYLYSLGISANTRWRSVDCNAQHQWYVGGKVGMTLCNAVLDVAGSLRLNGEGVVVSSALTGLSNWAGSINASGFVAGRTACNVVVNNSITCASNVYCSSLIAAQLTACNNQDLNMYATTFRVTTPADGGVDAVNALCVKNGCVGVGKADPTVALDVAGGGLFSSAVSVRGLFSYGPTNVYGNLSAYNLTQSNLNPTFTNASSGYFGFDPCDVCIMTVLPGATLIRGRFNLTCNFTHTAPWSVQMNLSRILGAVSGHVCVGSTLIGPITPLYANGTVAFLSCPSFTWAAGATYPVNFKFTCS